MGKLRHREVKQLVQSHTARSGREDWKSDCVTLPPAVAAWAPTSGTKKVAERLGSGNDRVLSVGEQQLAALPGGRWMGWRLLHSSAQ